MAEKISFEINVYGGRCCLQTDKDVSLDDARSFFHRFGIKGTALLNDD